MIITASSNSALSVDNCVYIYALWHAVTDLAQLTYLLHYVYTYTFALISEYLKHDQQTDELELSIIDLSFDPASSWDVIANNKLLNFEIVKFKDN